jgi:regulation of enolase protein 1 (concanavalin A-like superfamily)
MRVVCDTSRVTLWQVGEWLNPPPAATVVGDDLLVTAASGSDFWQQTSYGFRRDSGHALLAPMNDGCAVEVSFVVDYGELYDQAGLLVRVDERNWVKAGVEVSDGAPQLSAVVTRESSDWSVAPVPDWAGCEVTLRASWAGGALTLRACAAGRPWRLLRLAPFPRRAGVSAGPYCCAPEREGLTVRFTGWRGTDADLSLHDEG